MFVSCLLPNFQDVDSRVSKKSKDWYLLFLVTLRDSLSSLMFRFFLILYFRYDVYTPTRSLVFHSYQPQPENHGINEWFKQRRDRIRTRSLLRIKTTIEVKGGDPSDTFKANMGIYGIGKRRSLAQLNDFVGINLAEGTGNAQVNCFVGAWSSPSMQKLNQSSLKPFFYRRI